MKITMYELLGLVKDDKAPKKIVYNDIELEYSEENEDYYRYYGGGLFEHKFGNCVDFLDDEVEIIEEDKKLEKLTIDSEWEKGVYVLDLNGLNNNLLRLTKYVIMLSDEINNLKEND